MTDQPVVSVVVCTYNRAAILGEALKSVLAQETPQGLTFEVIVSDDGSTDDTAGVVARAARETRIPLRYLPLQHRGVSATRNAGVDAARGEWVAFMDDDEIANPNWLAELLATARRHGADCVSGRNELAPSEPLSFVIPDSVRKLLGDNGFMAQSGTTILPGGGNALIRRSLFAQGGFDPTLSYGEDADFFRRMRRAGAQFAFADAARIRHRVPRDRLDRRYLFGVAEKGAAIAACEDFKEGGPSRSLLICTYRLAHLTLIVVPRLARGWITRDVGCILGAQCSARYSFAYFAAATRVNLSGRQFSGSISWRP